MMVPPIMWASSYLLLRLPSNHVATHLFKKKERTCCNTRTNLPLLFLFLGKVATTECKYMLLNMLKHKHTSDCLAVSYQETSTRKSLEAPYVRWMDDGSQHRTSAAMESGQLHRGSWAVPWFGVGVRVGFGLMQCCCQELLLMCNVWSGNGDMIRRWLDTNGVLSLLAALLILFQIWPLGLK